MRSLLARREVSLLTLRRGLRSLLPRREDPLLEVRRSTIALLRRGSASSLAKLPLLPSCDSTGAVSPPLLNGGTGSSKLMLNCPREAGATGADSIISGPALSDGLKTERRVRPGLPPVAVVLGVVRPTGVTLKGFWKSTSLARWS